MEFRDNNYNSALTRLFLQLPATEKKQVELELEDTNICVEIEPGQFGFYLNEAIVKKVTELKINRVNFTVPSRKILALAYQAYFKGGLRDGLTFYAYYSQDEQLVIIASSLVSVDGDIINQVRRDFLSHQDSLATLSTYYWLSHQILKQVHGLISSIAWSLSGLCSVYLFIYKLGNSFLQGSLIISLAWFLLSLVTVLWFWFWTETFRPRLLQTGRNFISANQNRFSLQKIIILAIIILIFVLIFPSQLIRSIVFSICLLPCFYLIFRTVVIPSVSHYLLRLLFKVKNIEQIFEFFLFI